MKIQFDNAGTSHSAAPARWILTSVGIARQNGTWAKEESHLLVDLGIDTAESIKVRALGVSRRRHAQDSVPNLAVGFFFIGYDEDTFNRVVKEWKQN